MGLYGYTYYNYKFEENYREKFGMFGGMLNAV